MNAGMFVSGIIDNMDIELVNSSYINDKYKDAMQNIPSEVPVESFRNYLQCICEKDWIVTNILEIYTGHLWEE